MLSRDFLLLVILSCVIASPLAFYFLHGWLAKFEYRIGISAGAIKAATANPVDKLRSE